MINSNRKNGRGLSSIMGIIFLIAVTAVLAAMISAIAISMSNVPASKLVRVAVERVYAGTGPGTGIISVENKGGMNADMLIQGAPGVDCFKVMANGVQVSTVTYPALSPTTAYAGPQAGSIQYFQIDPGANVIVVACYTDGSEYQVWAGSVS